MPTFSVRRGRPRKFSRPSRAVTVTLPEDVIDALSSLDRDLSRAIVRLAMTARAESPRKSLEIAAFGGRAVLIVPPARVLAALDGVELVPLADGRALIALESDMSVDRFELLVGDALRDRSLNQADRALFSEIGRVLREARRASEVTVRRILVLRTPRASSAAPRPS